MTDKREEWKAELEKDLKNLSRGEELRKGGLKLSAKDFPKIIDGIPFQTIDEYALFFGASSKGNFDLEMESTDRPYDIYNENSYSFRNIKNYFKSKPSQMGFYSAAPAPKPSTPPVTMAKKSWKRYDGIEHMRYCIIRAANGLYHAVWVGLMPEAKLVLVMAEVLEAKHPIPAPQKFASCNVHSSKGYKTYWAAVDEFGGYESLYKTKDRLKKALDPTYIPPNTRRLAIEATFNEEIWDGMIPEYEHERLIKWLEDGCKGWFGKDANAKWYEDRGLAIPYRFTPMWHEEQRRKDKEEKKKAKKANKGEQLLLPGAVEGANGYIAEVWDGNLKKKVKKWFQN